jgi:hypothetical protein
MIGTKMKKTVFVLFTLSLFSININSQIQSTAIGGYWNVPGTWIGNATPGASDDVIINGPVVHASASGYTILTEYCNNLTITASGSLRNGGYGGGFGVFPLVVAGSVINNGVVSNGSEDCIKIFIAGDLENNNIWMPYETEFQTSNNHNLSLAPGKSFGSRLRNNGGPTFTALTDMLFTCDYSVDGNLFRDHFYLNGHTFNVGNHSIELRQCMINKGMLTGDIEILGTFTTGWVEGYDIRDTLLFVGNVTVTDTLTGNIYGGGYGIYKLRVNGNITNNGVIKDDYDTDGILNADDLEILITGNIINNGIWECNYVSLIGTETQYIFQNLYKQFDSYFVDLNATSKVQAQSNITITKDFDLNGATLEMEDYSLSIDGWLHDGIINNTNLHNGFLQNITSIDDLVIEGTVTIDDNNLFQGSVVIDDTLQSNEYGGGSKVFTLPVNGDITNYGVIKNINSGDRLSLEISGNIINYGIWENSFTKLTGSQDQSIFQVTGRKFVTDFTDLDSTSRLIATSDLKIEGNYNLNRATLQMDNYEIEVNDKLYNGSVLSPKFKNATLSNLKAYDNIEIRGVVVIDDGNYFYGDLIVTDTLQSQVDGGGAHTYVLRNYGNVENNGLIRDEPTQNENLALYAQGNIINHGRWTNYRTYQLFFPNDNSNNISCLNNSAVNWSFNGSNITGSGAASFSITSGGGAQTIIPNQSYDLSVLFTPTSGDTTALLNIDCTEIGTLNNIYLVGHNYNTTVDVEEEKSTALPNEFVLKQNYPNPFNPSTSIEYRVGSSEYVTLKVYDILGNEIATLVNEEKPVGTYEVDFNASSIKHHTSSGVYFYQLSAGDFVQTKKMILIK